MFNESVKFAFDILGAIFLFLYYSVYKWVDHLIIMECNNYFIVFICSGLIILINLISN